MIPSTMLTISPPSLVPRTRCERTPRTAAITTRTRISSIVIRSFLDLVELRLHELLDLLDFCGRESFPHDFSVHAYQEGRGITPDGIRGAVLGFLVPEHGELEAGFLHVGLEQLLRVHLAVIDVDHHQPL